MSLIRFAFIERGMWVVWTFSLPPHLFLAGTHGVVTGKLELLVALLHHISCSFVFYFHRFRLLKVGYAICEKPADFENTQLKWSYP